MLDDVFYLTAHITPPSPAVCSALFGPAPQSMQRRSGNLAGPKFEKNEGDEGKKCDKMQMRLKLPDEILPAAAEEAEEESGAPSDDYKSLSDISPAI